MKLRYLVLLRKVRNIVLGGIIFGVLLNSPFVISDFYHHMTRMKVFEQIRIGTSEQELSRILDKNDLAGARVERSKTSIQFSDFWRYYSIDIDPESHRVCGKGMYFHRREPLP